MRVAVPPAIGMTHSAPWAVNAMRALSEDGAATMLVPSCSSTVTSLVGPLSVLIWLTCAGCPPLLPLPPLSSLLLLPQPASIKAPITAIQTMPYLSAVF